MAAAGPAMESPCRVGLALNHLAQDADISPLSLRSDSVVRETRPAAQRSRFQATVDDDDSDEETVVASPARNKVAVADSSSLSSRTCAHKPNRDSLPPSSSPYPRATTPNTKPLAPSSTTPYLTPHPNTTLTPPSSAESSPKQRPTVHFSTRPPVVLHHRSNSYAADTEPSSPRYTSSPRGDARPPHIHLSVVDRQWGQLFTEHGEPTRRLGSVLRGLANYMVREYEPRNSLVIPPVKMFAFYRRYKLDKEQFPLQEIFDYQSRHCLRSLERLYQDLSCEYHLVQDHHHSARPFIPALTPAGLQTWLTAFIQASPDCESRRLQAILTDVPLEADHQGTAPAERLPKQLSRHLFPAYRSDRAYRDIACALDDWIKSMEGSCEPPSPSWSNLLFEAFRGTSSHRSSSPTSAGRRERSSHTDDHKRYTSRKSPSEPVTISPANTARRRQKPAPVVGRSPQEFKYRYSGPSCSSSQHDEMYMPELRYFPSSRSEPPRRRYSEPSPERIKHGGGGGHTSRRRDRSPKAARAASIDSARRHGHPPRSYSGSCYPRAPGDVDSIRTMPDPRPRTPDASSGRADSYRFFQGRQLGPTYEEFQREKARG
ncbi:uncharacterized protein MAM_04126 [Metarhizium album ARSEF 1941]|uniref:DUF7514 domain-containing protein n=1 Tax=Metarhizium album (strain ARSEF 1941) TaxID=1081103 RepID=A0A0B2WWF8_METAS|nr:uncharacterized protein MAM_04126 [Metarhizium album ARSEF 1941]KHN97737.1 hypothetical protein MAM_04126 [Metarhizium album ARSEF 1941]